MKVIWTILKEDKKCINKYQVNLLIMMKVKTNPILSNKNQILHQLEWITQLIVSINSSLILKYRKSIIN